MKKFETYITPTHIVVEKARGVDNVACGIHKMYCTIKPDYSIFRIYDYSAHFVAEADYGDITDSNDEFPQSFMAAVCAEIWEAHEGTTERVDFEFQISVEEK